MSNDNTAPRFSAPPATGRLVVQVDTARALLDVPLQLDGSLALASAGAATLQADFGGEAQRAFASAGTLQPGRGVALLADGVVVLLRGSATAGFSLSCRNANGTLQADFGSAGEAALSFDGLGFDVRGVLLQPDGALVAFGTVSYAAGATDFGVLRLNADGSPDTGFGSAGQASVDLGSQDHVRGAALQTNGELLIVGSSTGDNGDLDFSVARLLADGTLDTGFGGAGHVLADLRGYDDHGEGALPMADGIFIFGNSAGSDGSRDFAVLRLDLDGAPDASFGSNAQVIVDLGGDDVARGAIAQQDGGLLVYGLSLHAGSAELGLLRLDASGAPDTGFSGDGKATFALEGLGEERGLVVLQAADGSLVAVAASDGSAQLLHVLANGTLDGSLHATQRVPMSTLGGTARYVEGTAAVVLDADAVVYDAELAALGGGTGNYAGATLSLQRAGGASTQDHFSGLGGLSLVDGGSAVLDGVTVGSVSNASGHLSITFGAGATQARISQVLSHIAYSNDADAPPSQATLAWTFSDGDGADPQSVTDFTRLSLVNVNDAPSGTLTVAGTPAQHQQLVALHTLDDPDGMGTLGWQWLRDGKAIPGARADRYTLTQTDVGHAIAVRAAWTDAYGHAESVTSSTTAAVANVNDAPTGLVRLSGTAKAGQTLSASSTLRDGDGMGTLGWQWQRDGDPIASATGQRYKLTADDVGHAISVRANYLDGQGTQEHVSSAATVAVVAADDRQSGDRNANLLVGGAGASTLNGLGGNDTLDGSAGNDKLYGGAGQDVLTGGADQDVFVFKSVADSGAAAAARDLITDFTHGEDRIDLSAFDADAATAGRQHFTALIGAAAAFSQPGQLKLDAGVLYGNNDADADADFAIELTGVSSLSLSDFLL